MSDKLFLCYLPNRKDSIKSELEGCLERLFNDLAFYSLYLDRVLIISVFISTKDYQEFVDNSKIVTDTIKTFFRSDTPPISIIAQAPKDNFSISLEVIVSKNRRKVVESKSIISDNKKFLYKLIDDGKSKEIYSAGIFVEDTNLSIEVRSERCFGIVKKILNEEGLELSDIVRQWNYIEDITNITEENQNYQVFNNVRSRVYSGFNWINGYPAATGIGVRFGGIQIAFIAEKCNKSIIPIRNPKQIDAHQYSIDKLIGNPGVKSTPKFERGKIIISDKEIEIYVSGTAAIVGESTIVDNNIQSQTKVTIENIRALISPENLRKIGIETTEFTMKYIRVYIKHSEDFLIAMEICHNEFGNIPIMFVQADICRSALLIEIEGFASWQGSS